MDTVIQVFDCRTSGNSFSNSPATRPSPYTPPPLRPSSTRSPSSSNSSPSSGSDGVNGGNGGGKSSKVGGGAVAGIFISLVVLGAMVAFFFIKRKSMRRQQGGDPEKNLPLSPLASGIFKRKSGWTLTTRRIIQHYYLGVVSFAFSEA